MNSTPRVIPCLLAKDGGLVKTVRFKRPRYVGDPINAIRIFNEKEVDELVLLDIDATVKGRPPSAKMIAEVAAECFMPVCYGGGIRDVATMKVLFALGIEKVSISAAAVECPDLVRQAADTFGSQSVVVTIDVKKDLLGRYRVFTRNGRKNAGLDPVRHADTVAGAGAGEILLNSIDRDGTRIGYDTDLIHTVSRAVDIPVIASGGAGSCSDFPRAIACGASAVAAGSLFVFEGRYQAVLINYPAAGDLAQAFEGFARE